MDNHLPLTLHPTGQYCKKINRQNQPRTHKQPDRKTDPSLYKPVGLPRFQIETAGKLILDLNPSALRSHVAPAKSHRCGISCCTHVKVHDSATGRATCPSPCLLLRSETDSRHARHRGKGTATVSPEEASEHVDHAQHFFDLPNASSARYPRQTKSLAVPNGAITST